MAKKLNQETRDKLSKILPRLGTNFDGEIVSVVSAVHRVLTAGGYDWHDFTSAVCGNAAAVSSAAADPWAQAPSTNQRSSGGHYVSAWMQQLCEQILEESPHLSAKAYGFLTGTIDRCRRSHHVRMTEKQISWLIDLAAAIGRTDVA